ncbi:MAG: hypothetical protein ABI837_17060 [Acidobacteriota bacterium]
MTLARRVLPGLGAMLALGLLATPVAGGETFRLSGSAGAEAQLMPPNGSSPLNPGNVAGIPGITNVSDASVVAEAVTESRAWKLRIRMRGESSDRGAERLALGEAFLQISPRKWLDVTLGRVIEKWGSGYAWNPVAFVGPAKDPRDPNDRRSVYRGVAMGRADLFVRGTSVSLYALSHGAYAARVYRLIGGTDVSFYSARERTVSSGPPAVMRTRQGVSLSRVFGESLELHGEAAGRRVLVGGQYTLHGGTNVVVELYRSGDGLTERQWNAFRDSVGQSLPRANRDYRPLQMARNYAFLRLALPPGGFKTELEVIAITNLRDGSSIARATLTRKLRTNVSAYLIDTEFLGAAGSELSYMQVRRVSVMGLRAWF